jgi:hypothetical protein
VFRGIQDSTFGADKEAKKQRGGVQHASHRRSGSLQFSAWGRRLTLTTRFSHPEFLNPSETLEFILDDSLGTLAGG